MRNRCYWLLAIVIANFGFGALRAFAGPQGFVPIGHTNTDEAVSYSPDGRKVAIVRIRTIDKMPVGANVSVYSVDRSFQPAKLLFQDNRLTESVTEFQWVRNSFFYIVMKDIPAGMLPLRWWELLGKRGGLKAVVEHMGWRAWPVSQKVPEVPIVIPGNIFSFGNSETLLIWDTFEDLSRHQDDIDSKTQGKDNFGSRRTIRSFDVGSGTTEDVLKIQIPPPGQRWWGGGAAMVPFYMSGDGQYIAAIVANDLGWNERAKTNLPNIAYVRLADGKTTLVVPDDWMNGLQLSHDSDPNYFTTGNPMPLKNGKQVVCQLSMAEGGNDVYCRFGIFNWTGERVKDVTITTSDFKQANMPPGNLATWTADGKNALIQSHDVWKLNWEEKTGHIVAQNLTLTGIYNWLDDTHILVKAIREKDSGRTATRQSLRAPRPPSEWGILYVP